MPEERPSFPHPLYEKFVLQPFYRDAEQYYYEPMLQANQAHAVMLASCNIITQENARALLSALEQVNAQGLNDLGYRSGVEDLFFTIERRLIDIAGADYGGNLQLARSRNDLGYALTRMALRPLLLDAMSQLLDMRSIFLDFAREHLETLMPGYTHTQPAQPITMAHYMAGVCAFLARDMARLQFAWHTNNQSPLGAAALTGTGFEIDRELSASLLGFDSVLPSTYDGIATSDNLTDFASALSSLGVNLSRFTKDMLFWATREAGAIRIDDSFIQISSIMPQKRNPVVLEHIRARISRMIGYAQGIVIQCHNIPFGDTQDIEDEIFPILFGSLETASEILQLYTAVMDTLHVNKDHLRQRSIEGFTTVTELADTLVRYCNLPFRQAHSIVSGMVSHALENNLSLESFNSELLAEVSGRTIGKTLNVPDEVIRRALDPEAFVQLRKGIGGVAPMATRAILDQQAKQLDEDISWFYKTTQQLEDADTRLQQEIQKILA